MDHLERFADLLGRTDPPLDEALALIAAHRRDGVDPGWLVERIDRIASDCHATTAAGLCEELFGPGGFHGDDQHYHDAANSLLDQVLERRKAIPITLSVLAIEVGRRRGIGIVGIGLPGHFLVRDAQDGSAFFDPFRGGAPMDRLACRALFERLHGPMARFQDRFLEPASNHSIVVRVLANLHHSYMLVPDRAGLLRVVQLQATLPGSGLTEKRALADLLAAEGRFDLAADIHQELAESDPDPDQDHAGRAIRLRARMN